MKARIILMILLAIAVLISVLIIARGSESARVISNQGQTITNLEELVDKKDFAWTAADMEIDNLEQTILSQQERIQELMVKEEVLVLYKETLEYTLTWVYYAEELMTMHGVSHFEYIGEQVLSEVYFEELQEQYEFFDYVENGD